MINFRNDYSQTAHASVLEKLASYTYNSFPGYGLDERCQAAATLIKKQLTKNVDIHFITGGTSCNKIVITHALKPYESVIAVDSGHINVHETGAVEANGHKINPVKGCNGKITVAEIEDVVSHHIDEHMVIPKMVYISNSTETGTIYTKKELTAIAHCCRERDLYLYLDGARLGVALTADENDLTLADIATLTDVFYIGGTKNGTLLGEALVIVNNKIKTGFRHTLKQNGGMLAKGFIIGIQFEALFSDDLFYRLAAHANYMACLLRKGFADRNIKLVYPAPTNQVFVAFRNNIVTRLAKNYSFEIWEKQNEKTIIRLVTSWATNENEINTFFKDLDLLLK